MPFQHTPRFSRLFVRYPNVIRDYRIRAGLKQKELGALLCRSRAAVSSWERGITFPDRTVVIRLAKVLDTLVEALYHEIYSAEQYFEDDDERVS